MKKIFFAALMLSLIGCTRNFDEINQDKTKITAIDKSTIGQLYASSQFNGLILNRFRYQTAQSLFGDFYSQYFANFSQSFASDRYTLPGGWLNNTWNYFYQDAAPQIYQVLNNSKVIGLNEEYALALIWKVTMFHRMTDYFGPIPYSSVGTSSKSYEYDSQKDIYYQFFKELDEAIAILKVSKQATVFGTHDQIYGGNIKSWMKYANTLKLRLAIRISDISPADAKKYAEQAVADGVLTDNADDAWFKATASSNNPIGWTSQWDEFRMSATMESILVGYNDPRLSIYFQPGQNGEYHGVRNGVNNTQMNKYNKNNLSRIGTFFYGEPGKLQKFIVMPAAEAYFLRAEGAMLGWNMNGKAEDLYNEGIRKSFQQWGISNTAVISDYLNSVATPKALNDQFNSPAVSSITVKFLKNNEEQKHQIALQKWLALFPNGWEAWSSLRKSDYPVLYDVINSDNVEIPKTSRINRLQFPGTEYTVNPEGVKTGIDKLNGKDSGATSLWWDIK